MSTTMDEDSIIDLPKQSKVLDVIAQANIPAPAARASINLPCHIIRPYQKNPAFFGRTEILNEIRAALNTEKDGEQAKFALCGMGGMGKTQIALAYAFESLPLFPVVLWAHSDTRAKLAQSFAEFAFEMGLVDSTTTDQTTCRERLKRWFETAGKLPNTFAPLN